MTAEINQWLLFVLSYATFGLVVGGSVYFAFRLAESWACDDALVINAFIVLALVVGVGVVMPAISLRVMLCVFVAALCGFKFHQKSGGASRSAAQAITLMMAATLVALGCEFYVLLASARWLSRFYPRNPSLYSSTYFGFFLLFISVPLVPFLLWAYRSVRFRPGIDRHLKAGEADSE